MDEQSQVTPGAENTLETQDTPEQSSPTVENNTADQETHEESSSQDKPNRAQRRISDLSKNLRESQAENERLRAEQLEAQRFYSEMNQSSDPFEQYQSGELTFDQLKQAVNQTAEFASQKEVEKLRRELAQKSYLNDLEADSIKLERENPKFNPDSPEYDEEYVAEMAALYKSAYMGKPDAPKPSQFVASMEKLMSRAEAKGRETSSAELAQQVAQGAVTGGQSQGRATKSDPVAAAYEKAKTTGKWEEYFTAQARAELKG